MNDLTIEVSTYDHNNDQFRRDTGVYLVVEGGASIQRAANQLLDAVKATLVAMSYSEQNIAEFFEDIYFDESV